MESLQFLSLSGNDFHETIPPQIIDACPGLVIIELSSNHRPLLKMSFDVSSNDLKGASASHPNQ
ncbi:hypothetical protein LINGRAHAP2_LOCUS10846 [Linum grandiflorum]